MKTKFIKTVIFCCIVLSMVATKSFAQSKDTVKTGSQKRHKIEKHKVPKIVTETFIMEYPVPVYDWYGYPRYDFERDWYLYDPYLLDLEFPEFYIVEFTKDKTPHKVIYTKAGKKVATHKTTTSELPKAVTDAINKSEYSTWTIAKEKEEIFRDIDMDKIKVYKVEVTKGKDKHFLYYAQDGDLLKDHVVK